jgi:hypothetical protein
LVNDRDASVIRDAHTSTIAAIKNEERFSYVYDPVDRWIHDILVEDANRNDCGSGSYRRCLAGARACPPDNSGGVGVYAHCLDALSRPDHPDREEVLAWFGDPNFDPTHFDLCATNQALRAEMKEQEPSRSLPV